MAARRGPQAATRRWAGWVVAVVATGATASTPSRAADATRGAWLYEQRCIACHSVDADRVGPRHRGIVGRRAGGVPGFDYSPALRRARLVWTPAQLDRWLRDPEALLPGQAMNYSVSDARDRGDLIAYLVSLSAQSAASYDGPASDARLPP